MNINSLCYHQPVLREEVLDALNIQTSGIYIDATFGRGGHTMAILEHLGKYGTLLAFDCDPAANTWAQSFIRDNRFEFIRIKFSQLLDVIYKRGLIGHINGILLDLGMSSPQLADPKRGFSFRYDGILDMRMDPSSGQSAVDLINNVNAVELEQILIKFGEERFHRRITNAIVSARRKFIINTTTQLVNVILPAIPRRGKSIRHPATRVFQAIRIAVNNELNELEAVLPQALQVLAPYGRLVVISFHSLEDRLVKQFILRNIRKNIIPDIKIVKRLVRPSRSEILKNRRARSAILRAIEKIC